MLLFVTQHAKRSNPMSTTNVRALPEATTRRAALGAVLAAGAAVATALPAVAIADVASSHPDADLFALIERARTADSLANEADRAAEDVWEKLAPSRPQALMWTESDAPHWYGVRPGQQIPALDIDFLRKWLALARKPDPTRHGDLGPVYPTLAFVERAREIVRTKDEFEASWQAHKEHPDLLEANARNEAVSERWRELAMRVARTPAKTTEGMVAKLALIASGYFDDDLEGTYDGILASVAIDAKALVVNARAAA
jgi:hypothetical protein